MRPVTDGASRCSRGARAFITAGIPPASARSSMWYFPDGRMLATIGVASREAVEVLEPEGHARSPGDRRQVDDRVRRAADRHQDPHRVLERRAGEDPRGPEVLARHLDDPPTGSLGEPKAAGERRGNGSHARKCHPEGLRHRRHRAGGAHHHAGAGGGEELALDRFHAERVDLAGTMLGPEPAAVRARAEAHPS